MPRIILGSAPPQINTSIRSSGPATGLSPAKVEDRLRQKRSRAYVEAQQKLDAGGHIHNRQAVDALLAAVREELPEISIEHLPLGFVARCYLGHPYEVHTLDYSGQIVQHYKIAQALPASLERARALAQHPGYAFIEVYPDKLIAVAENGDTSLVKI